MDKFTYEDDLDKVLRYMNKFALSVVLILFQCFYFIRGIFRIFVNGFDPWKLIPIGITIIVLSVGLIINNFKGYQRKFNNISFYLLIVIIDIMIIFNEIRSRYIDKDSYYGLRQIFMFITDTLIISNIRVDNSFLSTLLVVIFQTICVSVVMIIYGYENDSSLIYYDVIFLTLNIFLTFINFYFRNDLLKNVKRLLFQNAKITQKYRNILNTINSPLFTVNLSKYEIIYNKRFRSLLGLVSNDKIKENIWFFDQYQYDEKKGLDYLILTTGNIFKNIDHMMISLLKGLGYVKIDEKNVIEEDMHKFYEMFEKCNNPSPLKKLVFIKNLEILNNLLNIFTEEHSLESNQIRINYLNESSLENTNIIYKAIAQTKNTYEFVKHGTFKYISDSDENVIEIYFKRNKYKNSYEMEDSVDILINDISNIRKKEMDRAFTKMRMKYLAKIAHEFKTPINSMMYFIENIIQKIKNKEAVNQEDLNIIQSQANLITILIQDLNDYNKDIQELDITKSNVELKEIVNYCFNILKGLILRKNMNLTTLTPLLEYDESLPKYIYTDEKRLKQVLVNILSNSLKLSLTGYIKLSIRRINQVKEEVKFTIENTGTNMNNEHSSSPYYNNSGEERPDIGLSISKKIIEKIGNNYSCNKVNNKTCVSFSVLILEEGVDKEGLDSNSNLTKKIINSKNILSFPKNRMILNNGIETLKTKNLSLTFPESRIKTNSSFKRLRNLNSDKLLTIPNLDINKPNKDSGVFIPKEDGSDSSQNEVLQLKSENKENPTIKFLKSFLHEDNELLSKFRQTFYLFSKSLIKFLRLEYHYQSKMQDHNFILLVDDEKLNAKSIKLLIKSYLNKHRIDTYTILYAQDGLEALFLLLYSMNMRNNIKLMITDLNMKFMDGIYLIEIASNLISKNMLNKMKISLYSAELLDKANSYTTRNLHIHLLNKPCTKKDIEELLNEVLI